MNPIRQHHARFILALAVAMLCCSARTASSQTISYLKDIQPILSKKCLGCHGGVKRAGGLSFLSEHTLTTPTENGAIAIVPGKPAESEMVKRILSKDDAERMPPADHGAALPEHEAAVIKQ